MTLRPGSPILRYTGARWRADSIEALRNAIIDRDVDPDVTASVRAAEIFDMLGPDDVCAGLRPGPEDLYDGRIVPHDPPQALDVYIPRHQARW